MRVGHNQKSERNVNDRYNITEIELRTRARQRRWRVVQYMGLALLAAAAGTMSYVALFRQY